MKTDDQAQLPTQVAAADSAERSSYTTHGIPLRRLMRTGIAQWRAVRAQARDAASENGAGNAAPYERFRNSIRDKLGMKLAGLTTLEIGHGQTQTLIAFVASQGNVSVGIDMDVTPHGLFDLPAYVRIWRANGPVRMIKSLARELSGVNRAVRRAFVRGLGLRAWPSYRSLVMDVSQLQFPDESFDLVYSTDVFEHVADPERALREVTRVLRPGGGLWIRTLHYLHHNALHDLRPITGERGGPQPWAHLIPSLRHTVEQGAFVNTFTPDDWRQLADNVCPGSEVSLIPDEAAASLNAALAGHREAGELERESAEQLLARYVLLTWRKPPTSGRPDATSLLESGLKQPDSAMLSE